MQLIQRTTVAESIRGLFPAPTGLWRPPCEEKGKVAGQPRPSTAQYRVAPTCSIAQALSVGAPASDVLAFGLTQQKPAPNSARENGPQKHFVSFSQVRRGKLLMRAIDIETKSTPKPFPLAQISGHFFLQGLPYGTSEVLDVASHHTQRKGVRFNPTGLLRVPKVQQPKMRSSSSGLQERYRRSCRKRLQIMKKARSEPQGISKRLKKCRSVGHRKLLRPDRTRNRSTALSALTEMAAPSPP